MQIGHARIRRIQVVGYGRIRCIQVGHARIRCIQVVGYASMRCIQVGYGCIRCIQEGHARIRCIHEAHARILRGYCPYYRLVTYNIDAFSIHKVDNVVTRRHSAIASGAGWPHT